MQKDKLTYQRLLWSSLLLTSSAIYLIMIFILAIAGKGSLFSAQLNGFSPNKYFYTSQIIGWGHFLINAIMLLIISIIGVKNKKKWSFFTVLAGCAWVFIFDLIGTQIYLKMMATPLVPAIFVFFALWLTKDFVIWPSNFNFEQLKLNEKLVALYGLYLFTVGCIALILNIFNKTIVNHSNVLIKKEFFLAVSHIGWANLSGSGLAILSLLILKPHSYDSKFNLTLNTYIGLSFLNLITGAVFFPPYRLYEIIPIVIGSAYWLHKIYLQNTKSKA